MIDGMNIATAGERPELLEPSWERTKDALPEYNNHGDVLNAYWPRLTEELPDFQFTLADHDDEILARGRSIPVRWNGTVEDLPAGIDGAIARGFEEDDANTLCALLIVVPRDRQSEGLSAVALRAMGEIARRNGLSSLIAPVRPSAKEHYPLIAIERYAAWRRPDGLLFDPWMRVHERLGASVLRPEPESLRITGTVEEWQTWTEMQFPEDGDFWFPRGLATVSIDHAADRGRYWEPNVWMHHSLKRDPETYARAMLSEPRIRHTVAFTLRHEPGSAEEADFLAAAAKLAAIPGVETFELLAEVSPKNDYRFGISMEFADRSAYEGYNAHPDHIRFVETRWVPEVRDFLELDYAERG